MAANYSEIQINSTILMQMDLDQFINEDMPAFIFLLVLCAVGVLGNAHALKVFQHFPVSSITFLIRSMALLDLILSGVCIPLDIVQLRFTLTYPSGALCKITRYLVHFCSFTTLFLLVTVAIERRRKIYSSLNHLSVIKTKKLIAYLVLFAACLSISAVVYYDIHETKFQRIIGNECRRPNNVPATIVYESIVTLIVLVSLVICSVAYIQIVNLIRKQIKREKPNYKPNRKQSDGCLQYIPSDVRSERNFSRQSTLQRLRIRKQRYQHSRRLTVILLIGTCASIVGYFLHVSAYVIRTVVTDDVFYEIASIYQVLLRSYFLHSAVNPIIFLIVDHRFRTHLRGIYSNMSKSRNSSRDSTQVITIR